MSDYVKEGFLRDMTRPVAVGDRVNVHVVKSVQAIEPDYEAMRRVIAGDNKDGEQAIGDERAA